VSAKIVFFGVLWLVLMEPTSLSSVYMVIPSNWHKFFFLSSTLICTLSLKKFTTTLQFLFSLNLVHIFLIVILYLKNYFKLEIIFYFILQIFLFRIWSPFFWLLFFFYLRWFLKLIFFVILTYLFFFVWFYSLFIFYQVWFSFFLLLFFSLTSFLDWFFFNFILQY
jgi:hypothetical protein